MTDVADRAPPKSAVAADPRPRAPRLRPGRLVLWLVAGVVLLFMAIPTIIVIPVSLNTSQWLDFPPEALTLDWYRQYLSDPSWRAATWLSLRIGLMVMLVTVVVGTMGALALVRGMKGGNIFVNTLVTAPLIVPTIVYAIAVLLFFSRVGLSGTYWGFVIAHSALAVPYVVLIVSAALYRFDPSTERAAQICGASRAQAIWYVTLPAIRPALLAGGIFAFLTSFDEAIVSFFLADLTGVTLPRKMFENLQFFVSPVLAAVSTLLTILTVILVGLAYWLRGR
jgi:mannopine transport system permease protein